MNVKKRKYEENLSIGPCGVHQVSKSSVESLSLCSCLSCSSPAPSISGLCARIECSEKATIGGLCPKHRESHLRKLRRKRPKQTEPVLFVTNALTPAVVPNHIFTQPHTSNNQAYCSEPMCFRFAYRNSEKCRKCIHTHTKPS